MVPMAVDEVFGRKVIAERQRLEEHGMVAVGMQLEVEEQRGRAGDFVDEAAADTHGDIEVRRNVLRLHGPIDGTTIRGPKPLGTSRARKCRYFLISSSALTPDFIESHQVAMQIAHAGGEAGHDHRLALGRQAEAGTDRFATSDTSTRASQRGRW